MKSKKHLIELHGETFTVFDTEESESVPFIVDEWRKSQLIELDKPNLIVDIGAHVGVWSFLMARKYPKARIHAYEPVWQNFINLAKGEGYNHICNVDAFYWAVGNQETFDIELNIPLNGSGSSSRYIAEDRKCFVHSLRLATALEERADMVKIDIEGDEFKLFDGFTKWQNIGALHVEVHPWYFHKDQKDCHKMVDDFAQMLRSNMKGKPCIIDSSNSLYARL